MAFQAVNRSTYSSTFYNFSNEGIKIQIDNGVEQHDFVKKEYGRFFLKLKGDRSNLYALGSAFEGAFMPLFSPNRRYTCKQKYSEGYQTLSNIFQNLKKDPSDMSARKSLEDIIFESVLETLKQTPTNYITYFSFNGGTLPQRNEIWRIPSTNIMVEGLSRKYIFITNYDECLYEHKTIPCIAEEERTAYSNTLHRMSNDKHSKGMDRQVFDSGRVPFRYTGIEKKRFKDTINSIGGLEGWLEVEASKVSKRYMGKLFA